jgi:3-methyladenine DNA glycosylase/8-oxoguanine DNA glycosylase
MPISLAAAVDEVAGRDPVLANLVALAGPIDELIAALVTVRGIGRWTAEMYLMFELRRLDV